MNIREKLIRKGQGGDYCMVCIYDLSKCDTHETDCPVPALIAQFEAMSAVCEAAKEAKDNNYSYAKDRFDLAIALDNLAKLNTQTEGKV